MKNMVSKLTLILVIGSYVAWFYYKLIKYIFYVENNNQIKNYYNNKINKLYWYNNHQI